MKNTLFFHILLLALLLVVGCGRNPDQSEQTIVEELASGEQTKLEIQDSNTTRRRYDIDYDGRITPFTDGVLIVRYLFGVRGTYLIQGAVTPEAKLRTVSQIEGYLNAIQKGFDVDGNGEKDALTDGVLIVRYLNGLRGNALVEDAVGAGATRGPAGIEQFIKNRL